MESIQTIPWYRERWPWLLMAGPAIVVAAGIATAVIAWRGSDGLVADDYYTQGLAINRVLERDARAQALGGAATVSFNPERTRVRLIFARQAAAPGAMRLVITHHTRAGLDQAIELVQIAPGVYEGAVALPAKGAYRLQLESADGLWRIGGDWNSAQDSVQLQSRQARGAQ